MKLNDYIKKVINELQPQVKEAEFECNIYISSEENIHITNNTTPNKIKFKIKRK